MNKSSLRPFRLFIACLLGLSLILESCSASKKIGKSAESINSTEGLLRKMEIQQVKAGWFDGKAKIDFHSSSLKIQGNALIKMKKDSAVWISLRKLGFEVARALITRDSVYIINRINSDFTSYGLEYLASEYQLPPSFTILQQILLGNPFFLSRNLSSATNGDRYELSDKSNGKEVRYSLETANYRLRNMQYLETGADRQLNLDFEEYNPTPDKQYFSYLRKLSFNSQETGKVEIGIQFTQVELNVPTTMPFDVPARYKK
jgi:hypothetical protein